MLNLDFVYCYYAICFVFSHAFLHNKYYKYLNIKSNQKGNLLMFLCHFIMIRVVVPLIQGFEDAGDFTVSERLKTSLHVNLIFYVIVGSIGVFGIILLIMMRRQWLVLNLLILVILKYILLNAIGSKILLP